MMLPQGKIRSKQGNAISEAPAALWLVIVVMLYPMINFCALGIRSTLVFGACSQAALAASKARSYEIGTSTDPSAREIAANIAKMNCDAWQGVHFNSVTTQIVITSINTQNQSRQTGKLSSPPNTTDNTYQIELTLNASVDPFIFVTIPLFENIQGISAPYNLSVTQRNYFENPQGLTR